MSTDPKRWVAGHVSTLPKSGIRDFFELVAKMKGQDVISLGVGELVFAALRMLLALEAAVDRAFEKPDCRFQSFQRVFDRRRARHARLAKTPLSRARRTVQGAPALSVAAPENRSPGKALR